MGRIFLFGLGILLMVVLALCVLWLLGQLAFGAGLLLIGLSSVLFKLLWFGLFSAIIGSLVYVVASAWRPVRRTPTSSAVSVVVHAPANKPSASVPVSPSVPPS